MPPKSKFGPKNPVATANVHDSPQKLFQPYIFSGKVSLTGSEGRAYPIQILRDTGAAQTILTKNVIPNITSAYTDEKVILSDFSSHPSYPLANIHLQCPLIKGKVQVVIKSEELPVQVFICY